MSIIGIVTGERQAKELKKQVEEENLKVEIICINYKSIENIKNVKFEILIIHDSLEKLKEKQVNIKQMLKSAKYVLLNSDIVVKEKFFKDINVKILTYGLKQKSTITASSMEEKRAIISIQRAFQNLNGEIIEQQEIPINLMKDRVKDLYNSLIKIAIIKIYTAKSC